MPVEAELNYDNLRRVHQSKFPLIVFLFDTSKRNLTRQKRFASGDIHVVYHTMFEECFTLVGNLEDFVLANDL